MTSPIRGGLLAIAVTVSLAASAAADVMTSTSGNPTFDALADDDGPDVARASVDMHRALSGRGGPTIGIGEIRYDPTFLASLDEVTDGDRAWQCLSEALYFEARGESPRGIFAVAEVILNRVDDPAYPDTVCDVVNQGVGHGLYACQFSYKCDGLPERMSEPRAVRRIGKIARLMLDGLDRPLTAGATHYHTKAVAPSWARVFTRTTTIGTHLFYRDA